MTSTRLFTRAVIRLSSQAENENVAEFLQGLITNDAQGPLPCWAALLSPQGKVLFDFLVWPAENGDLLLDCEAEYAPDLVKRLSLYRLRRKITIAMDDTLGVHWQADARDGAAADPRMAGLGVRWLAPIKSQDSQNQDNKGADQAWLAHRLRHGVTEARAELGDGQLLWLECNAAELNGVSFEKGCYVGQENTARMNWRQKINRRLLVVPLDRSTPERQRATYPELGFAVDHMRVDNVPDDLRPGWWPSASEGE